MKISKRNPLLRDDMEVINNSIGSLGEEIKEQNLDDVKGGSTPACVEAGTVVATAVSAAATWVNDKFTAKYKCGGVFTATAECQGC